MVRGGRRLRLPTPRRPAQLRRRPWSRAQAHRRRPGWDRGLLRRPRQWRRPGNDHPPPRREVSPLTPIPPGWRDHLGTDRQAPACVGRGSPFETAKASRLRPVRTRCAAAHPTSRLRVAWQRVDMGNLWDTESDRPCGAASVGNVCKSYRRTDILHIRPNDHTPRHTPAA